jgi:hypothetical protein
MITRHNENDNMPRWYTGGIWNLFNLELLFSKFAIHMTHITPPCPVIFLDYIIRLVRFLSVDRGSFELLVSADEHLFLSVVCLMPDSSRNCDIIF